MNISLEILADWIWSQTWQITAVALIVFVGTRLWGHGRPHLAYLLWFLVIVKSLTPPIWTSPSGVFSWLRATRSEDSAVLYQASDSLPMQSGLITRPDTDLNRFVATPPERQQTIVPDNIKTISGSPLVMPEQESARQTQGWGIDLVLVTIWLLGAATSILILSYKWVSCVLQLQRTRIRCSPELKALFERVSHELKLRHRPRLIVTSQAVGPAACSLLKPTIVLPKTLVEGESTEKLAPIIAHEMIHVRRGDLGAGKLQLLAQIIWWFHPAVWLANKEIYREREHCCDAEVISSFACDPSLYAQSILQVLKIKCPPRGMSIFPGVRPIEITSNRLENIMKNTATFSSRTPSGYWVAILILSVILLPGKGLKVGSNPIEQQINSEQPLQAISGDSRATTANPAAESTGKILNDARVSEQTSSFQSTVRKDAIADEDSTSAMPTFRRAEVFIGQVERGDLTREARVAGTLTAEDVHIVSSEVDGIVNKIHIKPGSKITKGTLLLELSNAKLEQQLIDAQLHLKAGEAEFQRQKVEYEKEKLDQEAALASLKEAISRAKIEGAPNIGADLGEGSAYQIRLSELQSRMEFDVIRQQLSRELAAAQLRLQEIELEKRQRDLEFAHLNVKRLKIHSERDGVVLEIGDGRRLLVGQKIAEGASLAKTIEPNRLVAVCALPEQFTWDVRIGQSVQIETRKGNFPGRVSQIDPTIDNGSGTLMVHITLDGPLPQGARPGLSVHSVVDIETYGDVVYVQRPVHAPENDWFNLFKLTKDGTSAVKTRVRVGRWANNYVEVLEGLREGDEVILSDMSSWERSSRIVVQTDKN